MWRIFSLAILALIPVGRVGAQDKRSLIVEVLQTAGDYGDIAPVWGIVQKDGDIYRFVPSVAPLKEKYRISDRYGYRTHPISGERQFHAGLDMAAVYAATVHAAASGTVTFAGERRIWENGSRYAPFRISDQIRTPDTHLHPERCGGGKGGRDRVRGKHRDKYRESFAL